MQLGVGFSAISLVKHVARQTMHAVEQLGSYIEAGWPTTRDDHLGAKIRDDGIIVAAVKSEEQSRLLSVYCLYRGHRDGSKYSNASCELTSPTQSRVVACSPSE